MRDITKTQWVLAALILIVGVLALGNVYQYQSDDATSFTPENVATFYVAGSTGYEIQITAKENISAELGAVEAYLFTVSPVDDTGEATVVVAKTDTGGWIVVPQEDPTAEG